MTFHFMINLHNINSKVIFVLCVVRFVCAEPKGLHLVPLVPQPTGLPLCPVNMESDDPVSKTFCSRHPHRNILQKLPFINSKLTLKSLIQEYELKKHEFW